MRLLWDARQQAAPALGTLIQCRQHCFQHFASIGPSNVSRFCFDISDQASDTFRRRLAWQFNPLHWKQDGGTLAACFPSPEARALFASHANPWLPVEHQCVCSDPQGFLSVWHDPAGYPALLMRELHWEKLHRFLCAGESLAWSADAEPFANFDWSAQSVSTWLVSRGVPADEHSRNHLGAWIMDCVFTEIAVRCRPSASTMEYVAWPNDAYVCLFDHASRTRHNSPYLGNLVESVAQVFFLNGQYALLHALCVSAARAAATMVLNHCLDSIGICLREWANHNDARYGSLVVSWPWQQQGLQFWHPQGVFPAWAYTDDALLDRCYACLALRPASLLPASSPSRASSEDARLCGYEWALVRETHCKMAMSGTQVDRIPVLSKAEIIRLQGDARNAQLQEIIRRQGVNRFAGASLRARSGERTVFVPASTASLSPRPEPAVLAVVRSACAAVAPPSPDGEPVVPSAGSSA
jgi:hypothetical protein